MQGVLREQFLLQERKKEMAIRKIREIGDEVLGKKCKAVTSSVPSSSNSFMSMSKATTFT